MKLTCEEVGNRTMSALADASTAREHRAKILSKRISANMETLSAPGSGLGLKYEMRTRLSD